MGPGKDNGADDKSNVVLIGMPGAGKSTLGVLLAKAIGKAFIDTDLLIQASQGKLLQEIIIDDGVDGFLKIEENVLLGLDKKDCVIATGGSTVYSRKAMDHLKEHGIVIYIALSYKAIEERISNIATRGIAMGEGQKLSDLYSERVLLYRKYSDLTINCEDLSIEESVAAIIDQLKTYCSGGIR